MKALKKYLVVSEATKVVLPLAMIRIDEPRAHDLLIVLPICARGRVVRRVGARNLVMERLATKGEMDAVLRRIKCGSCGVETHKPANLKDPKGGWCGIKFFQCGPCGPVAKVIIQLKWHVETNHESSSQCRCEEAGDTKEVNDNTVEVNGLAVNGMLRNVSFLFMIFLEVSEALTRTKATKMEDYFIREGKTKKVPEVVMERDKRVTKRQKKTVDKENPRFLQIKGS